MITLVFIVVILFLLYQYGKKNISHWKNRGVKQLNPLPFIGDHYPIILKWVDGLEMVDGYYKPFKDCGYGGIYMMSKPFLVVTDPDLLKQIMVKDSEYFLNRFDWGNNPDSLLGKNLAALKDEKWKKMRGVLTTVFTSSKMKDMFKFMDKCGNQATEFLEKQFDEKKLEKDVFEVDLKDFFARYGSDIIGSTAFGIEVDSFKNPNNEFYQAGVQIRKLFQGRMFFKMMFLFLFPNIAKMLNISMLGKECDKFFINVISETIKERELKNIVRKDVIHILTEARKGKETIESEEYGKGKLPDLTDLDITAQALIFFLAGFETISSLLSFICYELAVNPDIQEKVHEEIDEVLAKENGTTYDGIIHQMTYLHMVIYETLRKWPPAVLSDRVATKSYVIQKTDKYPELKIEKGEKLIIPISGFHYDPDYFPNPTKFDPERFRDEKNTIQPFTFLAFGEGPRHCIGFRFALMEAKCVLVHLLKRFTIVPTAKTLIPMKLSKNAFGLLYPKEGFALGVQKRDTFYA